MIDDVAVARRNIKAQERLQSTFRMAIDNVTPKIVAERLGIPTEDLELRLQTFGDFTLTELRLLAIATQMEVDYVTIFYPRKRVENTTLSE